MKSSKTVIISLCFIGYFSFVYAGQHITVEMHQKSEVCKNKGAAEEQNKLNILKKNTLYECIKGNKNYPMKIDLTPKALPSDKSKKLKSQKGNCDD